MTCVDTPRKPKKILFRNERTVCRIETKTRHPIFRDHSAFSLNWGVIQCDIGEACDRNRNEYNRPHFEHKRPPRRPTSNLAAISLALLTASGLKGIHGVFRVSR